MRSRGWGYLRQDWYSICSQHRDYRPTCIRCTTGTWNNRLMGHVEHLIYRFIPGLWKWYVNREHSRSRKQLMQWFPNLR